MIEQQIVDGKRAQVVYLTRDFKPANPDEAELVKIIFEDGTVAFAVPDEMPQKKSVPD